MGECVNLRAERVGPLKGKVSEAADTDDANFLARSDIMVLHRRVGSDAGAEEGRGFVGGDSVWDRDGEVRLASVLQTATSQSCVHGYKEYETHIVGVPALAQAPVLPFALVRLDLARAKVLPSCLALRARQTGARLRTEADALANLEILHVLPDAGDAANNLVPDDGWELALAPLLADPAQKDKMTSEEYEEIR